MLAQHAWRAPPHRSRPAPIPAKTSRWFSRRKARPHAPVPTPGRSVSSSAMPASTALRTRNVRRDGSAPAAVRRPTPHCRSGEHARVQSRVPECASALSAMPTGRSRPGTRSLAISRPSTSPSTTWRLRLAATPISRSGLQCLMAPPLPPARFGTARGTLRAGSGSVMSCWRWPGAVAGDPGGHRRSRTVARRCVHRPPRTSPAADGVFVAAGADCRSKEVVGFPVQPSPWRRTKNEPRLASRLSR